MSRYTHPSDQDRLVVYGHDHAEGYFFHVFDGVDEDGEDILTINETSLFTGMTKNRMFQLMVDWKVPMEHIELVSMVLPI